MDKPVSLSLSSDDLVCALISLLLKILFSVWDFVVQLSEETWEKKENTMYVAPGILI